MRRIHDFNRFTFRVLILLAVTSCSGAKDEDTADNPTDDPLHEVALSPEEEGQYLQVVIEDDGAGLITTELETRGCLPDFDAAEVSGLASGEDRAILVIAQAECEDSSVGLVAVLDAAGAIAMAAGFHMPIASAATVFELINGAVQGTPADEYLAAVATQLEQMGQDGMPAAGALPDRHSLAAENNALLACTGLLMANDAQAPLTCIDCENNAETCYNLIEAMTVTAAVAAILFTVGCTLISGGVCAPMVGAAGVAVLIFYSGYKLFVEKYADMAAQGKCNAWGWCDEPPDCWNAGGVQQMDPCKPAECCCSSCSRNASGYATCASTCP